MAKDKKPEVQWEYKIVQAPRLDAEGFNEQFSKLGLDGWELVCVVSTSHAQVNEFAYFKRIFVPESK